MLVREILFPSQLGKISVALYLALVHDDPIPLSYLWSTLPAPVPRSRTSFSIHQSSSSNSLSIGRGCQGLFLLNTCKRAQCLPTILQLATKHARTSLSACRCASITVHRRHPAQNGLQCILEWAKTISLLRIEPCCPDVSLHSAVSGASIKPENSIRKHKLPSCRHDSVRDTQSPISACQAERIPC